MIALERVAAARNLAVGYTDLGIAHEGDCLGSLCRGCGHCLHSVETCDHDCDSNRSGCSGAEDDETVLLKRAAIEMADALTAVLVLCESSDTSDSAYRSILHTTAVRAAIDKALRAGL